MAQDGISKSVLARLPVYLNYLKSLPPDSPKHISATSIASALGFGEVQVRKDLASVSGSGKPRVGYETVGLIFELESFLGYNNINQAFIVGAGKLGRALLEYKGFQSYGLVIVAAFDINEDVIGQTVTEKAVLPLSKFEDLCKRMNIKIGIITVPAEQAQDVCDMMIRGGILAIWNFAPTHLEVPEKIFVHNENMATSLALLSVHLTEQMAVD